MARIRSIKPEFPQSESMGRVSRDARLLFIELWTICDDEGRARGNSRMLASLLFPYDDDAPNLIDGWIIELEREGCIIRYAAEGATYIQVCNWLNHQKIDHASKSKIPPFDESSRILAKPREPSWLDQGSRIKEGIKDQGLEKDSCAEPSAAAPPVSEAENFITLQTNTGHEFPITEKQVEEFAELYPSVDVRQQLRNMRGWLLSNPAKRKTKTGMLRFVTTWLSKEQDDTRNHKQPGKENIHDRRARVAAELTGRNREAGGVIEGTSNRVG